PHGRMTHNQKDVIIVGSTGSIGRSALCVVEKLADRLRVVALAAHSQWQRLAEQALQFRPAAVAIVDDRAARPLRDRLHRDDYQPTVFARPDALARLVREIHADFLLAAVVGAAGLPSTLAAVERGMTIGLANKETLVVAGSLVAPLAARTGATLIPVDSEHSAIFQAMHAGKQ